MTHKSNRSSDKRKMNERWSNQRKLMKGKGLADAYQEGRFGYVHGGKGRAYPRKDKINVKKMPPYSKVTVKLQK